MARDIWVISDTHFRHANILKFADKEGNLIRPEFDDVDAMDEHMIERWNSVVKLGDLVYHLGDVLVGDKEWFKKNWPRLNGSKRLIVGNHDDIKFLAGGGFFAKVQMWRMFPEFGLVLSHVPIHHASAMLYGSKDRGLLAEPFQMLNVHGHIHQNASPPGPYKCVCVEHTDYTPVNIEELRIIQLTNIQYECILNMQATKGTTMKHAILATILFATATPVFADSVNARIKDHYTNVMESNPVTKNVCHNVEVPVYGTVQRGGATGGDVLGGMIIGGLIGKGITGNDNGAAAGAVMGGIIAADQGNRNSQVVTGYRTERRCEQVVNYVNVEKRVYSHSTITFHENGRKYTLQFQK